MKKFLPLLALLMALPFIMKAQVTTSSLSGYVRSTEGTPLQGSSVEALHVPTGTVYRTVSRKDGRYDIVNMVPGGPYKVTVTFVGYSPFSQEGLTLPLGETVRYDASLQSSATELSTVVVSGTLRIPPARRKTGASTNISQEQLNSIPTLSRSLADFTKLTPQANTTTGTSFGGMSNRYNNITIDGAVNNDVFGLASSGTPGGQANTTPISLDAIQEIQVVLAPYDVSYGNFTGGGVNAITKSGTNELKGTAYYYLRNENTIGKDPVTDKKADKFDDKQYGLSLGGPIIKNKLFFFVNGELARKTQPTLYNAGEDGSVLTTQQAQDIADTLIKRYGYDPGTYGVFNAETQSNKIFGRIDWNITDKHRLTLRHNYIKAFDDNISRSTSLFRWGNNGYRFNNQQNITVAELRSRFSNTVTNNLIVSRHEIRDFRSTNGEFFPSVEISEGSGTIQFGSERSSTANRLDQDILEVTDNVKIFKGKNTFTIGTHNEFFKFDNLFINNRNGRWRFASISDFYANAPRQFEATSSADSTNPLPSANFKAAQLGFYVQDEIQFSPKFRLTIGLRADMPVIQSKPAYNKIVDSTFGGLYNTSNVPNKQLLWAPRIGFNYDVDGDRTTIVRGGAGIFTGRVPFVWISNQFANTGLMLKTVSQVDNTPTAPPYTVNDGNGFTPDVPAGSIGAAGASTSFEADIIDKDFKIPQVARFNLGIDKKLANGFNLTLEAMFSKTINNILYQDVNLKPAVGVVDPAYNNGFDKRIAFASSTNDRRINPQITNALLITNTNKGYALNLGATINKTWKHFFAQASYNYQSAADVNSGASSTAFSNWEFVQVVGDPNNPQLATSNYELKHRILGVVSTNFEYAKHFKTTISFFYEGRSGSPFTYLVNGDLNSDGRFGNDLIYVPANLNEIHFIDRVNSAGAVVETAAQQAQAFMDFIDNDKYLSRRKGKYAERNGGTTPWEHVVNARIAQDFYVMVGNKKHDLQITLDMFNLTNLLNKDWGRQYFVNNQAFSILSTVNRTSGPNAGKGYNYNSGKPWTTGFGSRWQGQIGLRYSFN